MEEPTDEMLQALMEDVAKAARESSAKAKLMTNRRPTLCVVAGPNGSGKTTTTIQLLNNEWARLRRRY